MYTSGQTPLVAWIKPWMAEEVFSNVKIPPHLLARCGFRWECFERYEKFYSFNPNPTVDQNSPLSRHSLLVLFIRPAPFWAAAPKGAMSYRIGGFCAYVRTYVRTYVRPPIKLQGHIARPLGPQARSLGPPASLLKPPARPLMPPARPLWPQARLLWPPARL